MTEAGWLKCQGVAAMLRWLEGRGSPRKFRLFAAASYRAQLLEENGPFPEPDHYLDSWDQAVDSGNVDDWESDDEDHLRARWDSPHAMAGASLGVGQQLWPEMADLVREIFGNPFRPAAFAPAWRTDTALSLARQMYATRDFDAMPILADALQDAGCDSEGLLDHCRSPGPHVRGCWVVDLVLGKE